MAYEIRQSRRTLHRAEAASPRTEQLRPVRSRFIGHEQIAFLDLGCSNFLIVKAPPQLSLSPRSNTHMSRIVWSTQLSGTTSKREHHEQELFQLEGVPDLPWRIPNQRESVVGYTSAISAFCHFTRCAHRIDLKDRLCCGKMES